MKMKSNIWAYPFILGAFFLCMYSCLKDDGNDIYKPGTVTDIDGNIYHTVTIGGQTWMMENLKTTKYRNGDPIPGSADNTQWGNLTSGAYCVYDNDNNNASVYGCLYNWYAVADSRNIAPKGWHVPTDEEWTLLTTYLGGDRVAGRELKEKGTFHWMESDPETINASGFTALPGGYRNMLGYDGMGYFGDYWTSTDTSAAFSWSRRMQSFNPFVERYPLIKAHGCSVRCLKD
jgi:uncharacterized protein (TIGR02145 family)